MPQCLSLGISFWVNVVLTWNFKHIANPMQMPVMRGLCDARGYRLPELASPLEMMEN